MILHGKSSLNDIIPLLLDASGNVIVSASQLTTTGGKVRVDGSGNVYVISDGLSPLSPNGLIKVNSNLNLPAGTSSQGIFTVPAGQRYEMTYLSVRYTGTVAGVTLQIRMSDGTNTALVDDINPVVSGKIYLYNIDVLFEAGGNAYCNVVGATLNDDFYGSAIIKRLA